MIIKAQFIKCYAITDVKLGAGLELWSRRHKEGKKEETNRKIYSVHKLETPQRFSLTCLTHVLGDLQEGTA